MAELRIDWLVGQVDHVAAKLQAITRAYAELGDRFLTRESNLELASRTAWLGQLDAAHAALAAAQRVEGGSPSPLAAFLEQLATAAIEVGAGADTVAADLVRDEVIAMLGEPGRSWYWRDRAALALATSSCPRLVQAPLPSRSDRPTSPASASPRRRCSR